MNIEILFKQTTSKRFKCKWCKGSICGEDGYVKINDIGSGGWVKDSITICMKCFKYKLKNLEKFTVNKSEKYKLLIKRTILKKL